MENITKGYAANEEEIDVKKAAPGQGKAAFL